MVLLAQFSVGFLDFAVRRRLVELEQLVQIFRAQRDGEDEEEP